MSCNQPITNGVKTLLNSASAFGKDVTRFAQHSIMGVRDGVNDFQENNAFYNDTASRQALIRGMNNIQQFPQKATNLLSQENVRHTLHHVGQYVPQPLLIGLGGLAGTGIALQGAQQIADKFKPKPKPYRSPLVYMAPALIAGMLLSEQLQKIQCGDQADAPKPSQHMS